MVKPSAIATRQAQASDAAFLERTFLTTLREPIAAARGSWDELRESRQFNDQLPLEHTQIVQLDRADIGFFTLIPEETRLVLNTLCIVPEQQCQGIGSEIMNRLIESARSLALPMTLHVLKANVRARKFYENLGFVLVGESAHHHQFRHVQRRSAA